MYRTYFQISNNIHGEKNLSDGCFSKKISNFANNAASMLSMESDFFQCRFDASLEKHCYSTQKFLFPTHLH